MQNLRFIAHARGEWTPLIALSLLFQAQAIYIVYLLFGSLDAHVTLAQAALIAAAAGLAVDRAALDQRHRHRRSHASPERASQSASVTKPDYSSRCSCAFSFCLSRCWPGCCTPSSRDGRARSHTRNRNTSGVPDEQQNDRWRHGCALRWPGSHHRCMVVGHAREHDARGLWRWRWRRWQRLRHDAAATTNPPPPTNAAPVANAGGDTSIEMPTDNTTFTGSATDDGLPTGSSVAYSWEYVSGPSGPDNTPGATLTTTTGATTTAFASPAAPANTCSTSRRPTPHSRARRRNA